MTFQCGKRLPMLLFCQWEAHSLGSEDVWAPIFCWWCCTWCSCSSGPGGTNLNNQKEKYYGLIWNVWWTLIWSSTCKNGLFTPSCAPRPYSNVYLEDRVEVVKVSVSYNHQTILTFCPKCWPGKDPGWSTQRLVRWTRTKCTGSKPGIYILTSLSTVCDHMKWWRKELRGCWSAFGAKKIWLERRKTNNKEHRVDGADLVSPLPLVAHSCLGSTQWGRRTKMMMMIFNDDVDGTK